MAPGLTERARLGPTERASNAAALAGAASTSSSSAAGWSARSRARRRHPGTVGRAGRGPGHRLGHLVALVEAVPRRPALPGAVRVRAGSRGAARARADADHALPAPGQAGAVPVPADQAGHGASLRRVRADPLRHHGRRPIHAAAPAADPGRRPAAGAGAPPGRAGRRGPVLRRTGRRRPAHPDGRPDGGRLRRGDRARRPRSSGSSRSRTGSPGCGSGTSRPATESSVARRRGDQRDRGVDRRTAASVRRPRPVQGPRVQGRAPGGATGPDPAATPA